MNDDPSRRKRKEAQAPADNLRVGEGSDSVVAPASDDAKVAVTESLIQKILHDQKAGKFRHVTRLVLFCDGMPVDRKGTEGTRAADVKRFVRTKDLTRESLCEFLDGRNADACVGLPRSKKNGGIITYHTGNMRVQTGQRLNSLLPNRRKRPREAGSAPTSDG